MFLIEGKFPRWGRIPIKLIGSAVWHVQNAEQVRAAKYSHRHRVTAFPNQPAIWADPTLRRFVSLFRGNGVVWCLAHWSGDYVACLCSTTLSFSVCVILNGSLRVFFFFFKFILFCKVRCHVAESYYSGDRWCYDWTKSDSLFRILIGTCGSHKTLVHGAVLCDYIFYVSLLSVFRVFNFVFWSLWWLFFF